MRLAVSRLLPAELLPLPHAVDLRVEIAVGVGRPLDTLEMVGSMLGFRMQEVLLVWEAATPAAMTIGRKQRIRGRCSRLSCMRNLVPLRPCSSSTGVNVGLEAL